MYIKITQPVNRQSAGHHQESLGGYYVVVCVVINALSIPIAYRHVRINRNAAIKGIHAVPLYQRAQSVSIQEKCYGRTAVHRRFITVKIKGVVGKKAGRRIGAPSALHVRAHTRIKARIGRPRVVRTH